MTPISSPRAIIGAHITDRMPCPMTLVRSRRTGSLEASRISTGVRLRATPAAIVWHTALSGSTAPEADTLWATRMSSPPAWFVRMANPRSAENRRTRSFTR